MFDVLYLTERKVSVALQQSKMVVLEVSLKKQKRSISITGRRPMGLFCLG